MILATDISKPSNGETDNNRNKLGVRSNPNNNNSPLASRNRSLNLSPCNLSNSSRRISNRQASSESYFYIVVFVFLFARVLLSVTLIDILG